MECSAKHLVAATSEADYLLYQVFPRPHIASRVCQRLTCFFRAQCGRRPLPLTRKEAADFYDAERVLRQSLATL